MNAYIEHINSWFLTKISISGAVVATVATEPLVRDIAAVIGIVAGITAICSHLSTIRKNNRKD
jgi:hypothetical protein